MIEILRHLLFAALTDHEQQTGHAPLTGKYDPLCITCDHLRAAHTEFEKLEKDTVREIYVPSDNPFIGRLKGDPPAY